MLASYCFRKVFDAGAVGDVELWVFDFCCVTVWGSFDTEVGAGAGGGIEDCGLLGGGGNSLADSLANASVLLSIIRSAWEI